MSNLSIGFSINTDVKQIYLKNALYNDINNSNYYFPNELLRSISFLSKSVEKFKIFDNNDYIFMSLLQQSKDIVDKNLFLNKYNLLSRNFVDFLYGIDLNLRDKILDKKIKDDDIYLMITDKKLYGGDIEKNYVFTPSINKYNDIVTFVEETDEKFYTIPDLDFNSEQVENEFVLDDLTEDELKIIKGADQRGDRFFAGKVQKLIYNNERGRITRKIYRFSKINKQKLFDNIYQILKNYKNEVDYITSYYNDLFKNVTLTTTVEKYKIIPKNWSILFQTTFKEYSRCFQDLKYDENNFLKILKIMKDKKLIDNYDKLISSSLQFDMLKY